MTSPPHFTPVLEIQGVRRNYQALRPLRIQSLTLLTGDRVALRGLDAGAAEVLVNLVTGAALPDEGMVRVFGRSTADISNGDDWLASLDRFGIVSPRAVVMEAATVEQNLAMPFTLQIDPVPADIRERVHRLAADCGIVRRPAADADLLTRQVGEVSAEVRARVHLARAIALDPGLLVMEHPTANVPAVGRTAFADDVMKVTKDRRLTTLVITQDVAFAARVAQRVLDLQPASGDLKPARRGWLW